LTVSGTYCCILTEFRQATKVLTRGNPAGPDFGARDLTPIVVGVYHRLLRDISRLSQLSALHHEEGDQEGQEASVERLVVLTVGDVSLVSATWLSPLPVRI
jgi:hypothetical protein